MKKRISLLMVLAAVAACSVDPQQAAIRRNALIQQMFPNPADQQGLDLVFPLESGGLLTTIEVAYFPQEVSQSEVTRRVSSFCARQNSTRLTGQARIKKDSGVHNRTYANGASKPVHTLWYSCGKAG